MASLIASGAGPAITEHLTAGLTQSLGAKIGDAGAVGAGLGELTAGIAQTFEVLIGVTQGDPSCCKTFKTWMDGLGDFLESARQNPASMAFNDLLGTVNAGFIEFYQLLIAGEIDSLRHALGSSWDLLSGIGELVSSGLAMIGHLGTDAVDLVAGMLGIEGGEGGVAAWLEAEIRKAWAEIQQTLAALYAPLQQLSLFLLEWGPAGIVNKTLDAAEEVWNAAGFLYENWGDPDLLERANEVGGILPGVVQALLNFAAVVEQGNADLLSGFGQLAGGLGRLLTAATGIPVLEGMRGPLNELAAGVAGVQASAAGLFGNISAKMAVLGADAQTHLLPIAEFFTSVAVCLGNPAMIPGFIVGWGWELLPDCLRGPLIDFLIDLVVGSLTTQPNLWGLGPMTSVLAPGMISFLTTIKGRDDPVKIAMVDTVARVIRGGSLSFTAGVGVGFFAGIGQGLADPFVTAYDLVTGLVDLEQWFYRLALESAGKKPTEKPTGEAAPQTTDTASPAQQAVSATGAAAAQDLGPKAKEVQSSFWPAVDAYLSGSGGIDAAMAVMDGAWGSLEAMSTELGDTAATALADWLSSGSGEYDIGHAVGALFGNLTVQAVLFYFTAGLGTAVVEGNHVLSVLVRFYQWTDEAMEIAFGLLSKLGGYLFDMVRELAAFADAAMSGAMRKLVNSLDELAGGLMRWAVELMEDLKAAMHQAPEADTGIKKPWFLEELPLPDDADALAVSEWTVASDLGRRPLPQTTPPAPSSPQRLQAAPNEVLSPPAARLAPPSPSSPAPGGLGSTDYRLGGSEVRLGDPDVTSVTPGGLGSPGYGLGGTEVRLGGSDLAQAQVAEAAPISVDDLDGPNVSAPLDPRRSAEELAEMADEQYAKSIAELREFFEQQNVEAQNVRSVNQMSFEPCVDFYTGEPLFMADGAPAGFAGTAAFDAREFSHGILAIEIRVKLLAQDASVLRSDLRRMKELTFEGVHRFYNRQHWVETSDGTRKLLEVNVRFVEPTDWAHLEVTASASQLRSDQRTWYTGLLTGDDQMKITYAHELGHQMGLPDEYLETQGVELSPGVRMTPQHRRPEDSSAVSAGPVLMGQFTDMNESYVPKRSIDRIMELINAAWLNGVPPEGIASVG